MLPDVPAAAEQQVQVARHVVRARVVLDPVHQSQLGIQATNGRPVSPVLEAVVRLPVEAEDAGVQPPVHGPEARRAGERGAGQEQLHARPQLRGQLVPPHAALQQPITVQYSVLV